MKKWLIKIVEALAAWCLIYLALWIVTGKWAFAISDDKWRMVVLVLLIATARTSAYIYGRWEIKHEG
jgi:uncharacterized membrane protein YpjA